MKFIKPALRLGLMPKVIPGRAGNSLSLTGLLPFDLLDPTIFPTDQQMWQTVTSAFGQQCVLDHWTPKCQGEVLVWGQATAPGEQPVARLDVDIRVGSVRKQLRVWGGRHWEHGIFGAYISEPEPFSAMPITHDRSFGGPDYLACPIGRGHDARRRMDGGERVELPNIEYPARPVLHPEDDPGTACLAPVDLAWPVSIARAGGTYDRRWQRGSWLDKPDDFDWGVYNVAPPDQRISGYFKGDESIELTGFHAEHPRIVSRLPGARCRFFVRRAHAECLDEVPAVLDTIWVLPSSLMGIALFRGVAKVRDLDATDIEHLMIAAEWNDRPKPLGHYDDVHRLRTDEKTAATYGLADSQLLPEPTDAQMERRESARRRAYERRAEGHRKRNQYRKLFLASAVGFAIPGFAQEDASETDDYGFPEVTDEDIEAGDVDMAGIERAFGALRDDAETKTAQVRGMIRRQTAKSAVFSAQIDSDLERIGADPLSLASSSQDFVKKADVFHTDLQDEFALLTGAPVPKAGGSDQAAATQPPDAWADGLSQLIKSIEGDPGVPLQELVVQWHREAAMASAGPQVVEEMDRALRELAETGMPPVHMHDDANLRARFVAVLKGIVARKDDFSTGSMGDDHSELDTFLRAVGAADSPDSLSMANEWNDIAKTHGTDPMQAMPALMDSIQAWTERLAPEASPQMRAAMAERLADLRLTLEEVSTDPQGETAKRLLDSARQAGGMDDMFENLRGQLKEEPDGTLSAAVLERLDRLQSQMREVMDKIMPDGGEFDWLALSGADGDMAGLRRAAEGIEEDAFPISRYGKADSPEAIRAHARDMALGVGLTRSGADAQLFALAVASDEDSAEIGAEEGDAASPASGMTPAERQVMEVVLRKVAEIDLKADNPAGLIKLVQELPPLGSPSGSADVLAASMVSIEAARRTLPRVWQRVERAHRDGRRRMWEPLVSPPPGEVALEIGALVVAEHRQGRSLAGRDLTGADLRGARLAGIDLTGAFLEHANLEGADLSGARCEGAVFSGAILDRASFRSADMRNANLSGSVGRRTDFGGADLHDAMFISADFTGADFSEVRLGRCQALRAIFREACFERSECRKGEFIEADLSDAILDHAVWTGANLTSARLDHCSARGATLDNAIAIQAIAVGLDLCGARAEELSAIRANLRGLKASGLVAERANWYGADLAQADFSQAQLDGSHFSKAILSGANFSRARLRRTLFNHAKLTAAMMNQAQLFEASLRGAELAGGDLRFCNLHRADCTDACLDGCDLTGARTLATLLEKPADGILARTA